MSVCSASLQLHADLHPSSKRKVLLIQCHFRSLSLLVSHLQSKIKRLSQLPWMYDDGSYFLEIDFEAECGVVQGFYVGDVGRMCSEPET